MSTKDWLEKDYYKILGVPKDADAATVKKAYRPSPVTSIPTATPRTRPPETRFKEVSEAYSVLSNPERRKEYDEARTLFGSGFRVPTGAGRGGSTGGSFNFDLGDLFGGTPPARAAAASATSSAGCSASGPYTQPRRGADVESEVTIGFREAVDGVTVPLRMTSASACTACAGTGARAGPVPAGVSRVHRDRAHQRGEHGGRFSLSEPSRECKGRGLVVDDPCPVCNGSGRGTTSRVMRVRIPGGVRDGQRIRFKGKGAPGERGGPAGDLYVIVHVSPHPVFGRRGEHLTVTVPVTFPEAALGAEIEVPTLNGLASDPEGAAGNAERPHLPGPWPGAARPDGTRGDLLATIEIMVPQRVDGQAKEAFENFRDAMSGDDVRADLMKSAQKGG